VGIDFKGGTEYVVETRENLDVTAVREQLAADLGSSPEVKSYGPRSLLVRTVETGEGDDVRNAILASFQANYPDQSATILKGYGVGPRFARDLKRGAIYSVIGSLFVIFAYIMLRFEWRFSVGAVAALFHDVIVTLGAFSLLYGVLPFSLQIDQTIIAAFLTIVGYSINDTVVIFDRIREYNTIFKTQPFGEIINRATNRTMSRSIITSGTTLLVVTVLFIFGGDVLRGFTFAIALGIILGSYSTIFVASPIVLELRNRFPVK
jgi:preprotein translocase SecF subunit